jgi:predicted amidophosphoribosyltransferase
MTKLVCFHGQPVCSFCGAPDVAPWRKGLARLLSRPRCPCCGRRAKRTQHCPRCIAAGHHALTLFDHDQGAA